MLRSIPIYAGLFAVLLLAGCGGGSSGAENGAAATPVPHASAKHPPATPASDADVEFAYRCRGVLSAAWAAKTALPPAEVPGDVRRIDLKVTSWWTGEAARREAAAGWTRAQRETALSGATRVLATRVALEEALPTIRQCLEQTPQ